MGLGWQPSLTDLIEIKGFFGPLANLNKRRPSTKGFRTRARPGELVAVGREQHQQHKKGATEGLSQNRGTERDTPALLRKGAN